jgi:hypothetical protein
MRRDEEGPHEAILELQRTAGNAAVSQLLAGNKEPDQAEEAAVDAQAVADSPVPEAGPDPSRLDGAAPAATAEVAPGQPGATAQPANGTTTDAPAPPPVKPTMTSETTFAAPDGSPTTRDKVGIGEKVTFTGNVAGTWAATDGKPATAGAGLKFVWTAPDRAASVTVTLTVGTEKVTKTMTVIEPQAIVGKKIGDLTGTPGKQGAGMKLWFNYHPLTVSFGNCMAREVSGPASNISGYFKDNYSAADLWHDSGDTYTRIRADNRDSAPDTASFAGYPKPWTDGGWDWEVPNRFKTITETGDGKEFPNKVTQSFWMDGPPHAGRSTVRKAGETAGPRSP